MQAQGRIFVVEHKIVGENRGEMGISLVTQDATKGSEHSRCTDLYALLNNFEHRVFCAESRLLYKGVLVRVLNLHRDQKLLARIGER